MGHPNLMFLLLGFVCSIFIGGALFCFYLYRLYKLTEFSVTWKPLKITSIGILSFVIGIIFALINFFLIIFFTYPEVVNVELIFFPFFILMYGLLSVSTAGLCWTALSARKFWKGALKIALEAAEKNN